MTTDEKLDYLIGKVKQLEDEIKKIKVDNEKSNYELNSQFYEVFRGLRDEINVMNTANYKNYSELNGAIHNLNMKGYDVQSRFREIDGHLKKVEENTPMNRLTEKIVSWSPMIMFLFIIWIFFIFIILQ